MHSLCVCMLQSIKVIVFILDDIKGSSSQFFPNKTMQLLSPLWLELTKLQSSKRMSCQHTSLVTRFARGFLLSLQETGTETQQDNVAGSYVYVFMLIHMQVLSAVLPLSCHYWISLYENWCNDTNNWVRIWNN